MACRRDRRVARATRGGLTGLVLVAVLVAASGCQGADEGKENGAKIAVIGDSISHPHWAYDEIHAGFEPLFRLSVSGVGGATLADSLAVAQEYEGLTPRAVVIEVGTNDVTQAAGGPKRRD